MGNAISLKNMGNPKYKGINPANAETTEISAVTATSPGAPILVELVDLKEGLIVSRAVARTALGVFIQESDHCDSDGKIVFTDALAGMVFADGFTVILFILFTNGQTTTVTCTKA